MERIPKDEPSPMESIGATRKLMEHVARRSVLSQPNVKPRFGAVATELRFNANKDHVSGRIIYGLHFPMYCNRIIVTSSHILTD